MVHFPSVDFRKNINAQNTIIACGHGAVGRATGRERGTSRFESCCRQPSWSVQITQPIETSDISRPREDFGKKLKSFCIKAFEAQSPHGASR
jgi:hypothetical protein